MNEVYYLPKTNSIEVLYFASNGTILKLDQKDDAWFIFSHEMEFDKLEPVYLGEWQ